jgi:hypothetical protein
MAYRQTLCSVCVLYIFANEVMQKLDVYFEGNSILRYFRVWEQMGAVVNLCLLSVRVVKPAALEANSQRMLLGTTEGR